MLIHLFTLSSLVVSIVLGQLVSSPCPDVLVYEPRNNSEELDRWYAVLSISTTEDLEGLWLKITLDRKAELLGNWFAESVSSDNIEYSIRNPSYTLEAGPPVLIRFFVKYNAASIVPTVKKILLNGKQICPGKNSEPTEPTLHISKPRPTSRPSSNGGNGGTNSFNGGNGDTDSFNGGNGGTDSFNGGNGGTNSFNNGNGGTNSFNGGNGGTNSRRTTTTTSRRPSRRTTTESYTSEILPFGGSSQNNRPSQSNRPDIGLSASSESSEDDFFSGDFNVGSTSRPASRPGTVHRQPTVQCGVTAQRPSPLISHGQGTTPGQWPWHIALYRFRYKGSELIYTCGGTLVSEQYVVTAAHCVTKPRTTSPVNKSFLIVYLGKYNLISFGNEVQDREIDQIIIHPDYNASLYFNDIAVLRLSEPAEINQFVRPCCLWEEDNNIENLVGHQGTVVGWGFDESKQLSKNLMQAQMPIVSTSTCLFSNRNFFSQFIFDKNYCAGFKNGTSVCNGDSGGGMVIPRAGTNGQDTVWQLRGVVSVGVALQGEGVCDPNQYIVFTDAAKYVNWIRRNIN